MNINNNEFTNGEITVSFQPKKCINAGRCARELSEVFRTSVIPWIDMEAAPTNAIVSQIKKCPSGALSFCENRELVTVK